MAKAKPQPKAKKPQPPAKARSAAAPRRSPADDPALDAFTQGLAALQQKDWKRATDLLEKSVELADRPELRDRARQLLAAAQQKAAEGAKPVKTPEVDPYLQAVYEKNRGNFKAALEACRKGGRDQKDERFAYLAASIHALEDRLEDAVQALTKAVELNPKNRIHAYHDPDFAELRTHSDHRHLFGLS